MWNILSVLFLCVFSFFGECARHVPEDDLWSEVAPGIQGADDYDNALSYADYTDEAETALWNDTLEEVTTTATNKTGWLRWTRALGNITKTAGDAVKLRCEVYGDPPPIKLLWYKNEAPLEPVKGRITVRNYTPSKYSGAALGSRLRITPLEVHDTGFYTCEATSQEVKVDTTGILRVSMNHWGQDHAAPPLGSSVPHFIDSVGPDDVLSVGLPGVGNVAPLDTGGLGPVFSNAPSQPETKLASLEPEPVCQLYRGQRCSQFVGNKSVYIQPGVTQAIIETKLNAAFVVISQSNDLSQGCEKYALPSLCYTAYPVCREDASLPPRRICRQDCDLLENELCQLEYALAKKHPLIGRQLEMPECTNLPAIGSPGSEDCLQLGMPQPEPVNKDEKCFWGVGENYRGDLSVAMSGRPCIQWRRQMFIKTSQHTSLLGGHSYCRNPGGIESRPFCYTEKGTTPEFCDIPNCFPDWQLTLCLVAGSLLLLLLLLLLYCCCRKRQQQISRNRLATTPGIKAMKNSPNKKGLEMSALIPGSNASSLKSEARPRVREFHLSNIRFLQELGEGAFGKVYKGEICGLDSGPLLVAIKTLKENATAKTAQDFRREVDLMSELRHPNIVCLLGVSLSGEPMCMLFEFMTRGDLHEFLMSHSNRCDVSNCSDEPPLDQQDFMFIAIQIAAGMEYLCSHHYVHRDLAARNCLVGENLVVKISDFGLSRDVYSSDYYRVQSKSLLPVRWMPPESILYGKFTTESDVWSYGVVLWEIYSYGLQPYYGYSNQEVIDMIRCRQLLPCPEDCPSRMYSLMMECWHEAPVRRPHFPEIHARLRQWAGSTPPQASSDRTNSTQLSRPPAPHQLVVRLPPPYNKTATNI
ncbi:tyrosine-protein kinase transmembrane receptor Ror-like isoform X1 [Homalodisca vitripennis]|uniref:tyrosine-protein kinase transmembrane receptor Ror-like isoform X1 n=1 Tax=Homalodisca vitripennis TaxID=197043 RepID=UPI001EEAC257|nr:tyrosine-protein kinase transmembrane receptor Ror-like isoform X1 [Homalodisca vitripennis]